MGSVPLGFGQKKLPSQFFKLDMIFWFKNFPLGYKVAFTLLTDMQPEIVLYSVIYGVICVEQGKPLCSKWVASTWVTFAENKIGTKLASQCGG